MALGAGSLSVAGHFWTASLPERFVTVTRTTTVAQPVTSLTVQLSGVPVGKADGLAGVPIQVIARPGHGVQVRNTVSYDPRWGSAPVLAQAVSGGNLMLSCAGPAPCSSHITVTVPPDVAVTVITQGAAMSADGLHGPLTAITGGGDLHVSDLAGALYADTEGGELIARGLSSQTVVVSSGGDETQIGFARPPRTVVVSSYGNDIALTVPGGPYAVNTGDPGAMTAGASGGDPGAGKDDGYGPPVLVGVPTSPGAPHTLTLNSEGGRVTVQPAR